MCLSTEHYHVPDYLAECLPTITWMHVLYPTYMAGTMYMENLPERWRTCDYLRDDLPVRWPTLDYLGHNLYVTTWEMTYVWLPGRWPTCDYLCDGLPVIMGKMTYLWLPVITGEMTYLWLWVRWPICDYYKMTYLGDDLPVTTCANVLRASVNGFERQQHMDLATCHFM